jgi:hypothetical protein
MSLASAGRCRSRCSSSAPRSWQCCSARAATIGGPGQSAPYMAAARTDVGRASGYWPSSLPGGVVPATASSCRRELVGTGAVGEESHNGGCDEPVEQCVQQQAADKFCGRHTSRIRHSLCLSATVSCRYFIRSAPEISVLLPPASFSAKTILSGDRSLGENQACLTARSSRSRIDRDQED